LEGGEQVAGFIDGQDSADVEGLAMMNDLLLQEDEGWLLFGIPSDRDMDTGVWRDALEAALIIEFEALDA